MAMEAQEEVSLLCFASLVPLCRARVPRDLACSCRFSKGDAGLPLPLSLFAKSSACTTVAAGSDSCNFGNQTLLMSPFSFTLDEGSSRSKRPYRWQQISLRVSGEVLAGHQTQYADYDGSCKAGCFCYEASCRGVKNMGDKKSTDPERN